MVAHINTVAFQGIEALDVDVQVSISSGLPSFTIVGLPDKAVGESRERVRAAIGAMGLALPPKRITVNLAPADMLKEGNHFYLPIALGLLAAMDVVGVEDTAEYGALIPIAGVLLAAVEANANNLGLICPRANGPEAVWAGSGDVLAARSLLALVNHFKGSQIISPPPLATPERGATYPDLKDIKGQETAKRALEVGVGSHAKLGEASLAHQGVLFLDEQPESSPAVLDALRQPTESGPISIARVNAHVSYPARFQLIAAMNPCRCGYLSDPDRAYTRVPRCAREYQARISRPFYDRIDLHVDAPELAADLSLPPPAGGSAEVAARVARARDIQRDRYAPLHRDVRTNAEAESELLDQVAMPDGSGKSLLTEAVDRMKLSARGIIG